MRKTLLAVLFCLAPCAASAAPCSLPALRFMRGVWRDDDKTTRSEERWTIGPDDRLMGSSWLLHADTSGGVIEAETITADAGVVSLRLRHFSADLAKAREEKEAPMVFTAASCGPETVVFDGHGTQAGEHMTYRRQGDVMTFVGDFIHQGQPVKATVTFRRAGD